MNANSPAGAALRVVALVTLSAVIVTAGCAAPAAPREPAVRPVKTMVVTAGDDTHVRVFPGKVEASKRVELAFQVSGLVVELPAREGQKVAKGELIARLREDDFRARLKTVQGQLDRANADLRALRAGERPEEVQRRQAQLRAAEARMANARTEYDRSTRLLRNRAISREDVERDATKFRVAQQDFFAARQVFEKGTAGREEDIEAKEGAVRAIEGQLVEAKLQLDDTSLRAPYDGVIAKRFIEPNQNVKAKQPVVRFQDVDEVEVAVDVPEVVMAAQLRSADIVRLVAEFGAAPGRDFPVHIKEVAQKADPVTQTFVVRVALKSPPDVNLLPGMTATVTLTYRRANILDSRIQVPISAVVQEGGEQAAWVIGPDLTVTRRAVKLGEPTGSRVEVVSGLEPGERIAAAGANFLREGMKVRDLNDALGGAQP
ncbi:MAG: efflux RND transporter periplasmic adaptor subunit [Gemmataceae bacterium]